MRAILLFILLTGITHASWGQSSVRIQLKDHQTIKGKWMGMNGEQDQYLVRQDNGTIIYVPENMVLKLQLYRSYDEFPRYDENRNVIFFGWSGALNATSGQENQNFKGAGIKGLIGYDWNHKYALELSAGYQNMNLGDPETFLPVTVTAKKYLTHGRYLLFGGIEAGYQWGLKSQWNSDDGSFLGQPWSSDSRLAFWYQPPHQRGGGPSLTPLIGIRKIGKYGWDHVFSVGLHLQKFKSEQLYEDDPFSRIEMTYRRWEVSYGMVF